MNYTAMKTDGGTSLAVHWLGLRASAAGGPGLIPGWGTRIPQTAWHGQKTNKQTNQPKNDDAEWPATTWMISQMERRGKEARPEELIEHDSIYIKFKSKRGNIKLHCLGMLT